MTCTLHICGALPLTNYSAPQANRSCIHVALYTNKLQVLTLKSALAERSIHCRQQRLFELLSLGLVKLLELALQPRIQKKINQNHSGVLLLRASRSGRVPRVFGSAGARYQINGAQCARMRSSIDNMGIPVVRVYIIYGYRNGAQLLKMTEASMITAILQPW